MSKPRRIEASKYYHVYSRGVNKCDTFATPQDYIRFQNYIEICNTKEKVRFDFNQNGELSSEKLVKVFCYCLMPNHFHFILQEISEGGISLFFQKILSGYVSYFNKRHGRTGALFGSRFKDKVVDNDIYFKHLINYVWNNPIKILNPLYNSSAVLKEEMKLTKEEILFAKEYPYKYFLLAPTELGRSE